MRLNPDVWIIIPAYNEEKHMKDVLTKVKKINQQIVVIDDGSSDNTKRIAEEMNVMVLHHKINLGKGAAIKTGCDFAFLNDAKYVVLMDADGQHKPEDIPTLLQALKDHDIIFGSRKLNKHMPLMMRFGNWFITTLTQFLYGIKLHDTQCGFRVLTKKAYEQVRWEAKDYSMETEMIARAGKKRLRYQEVPIETIYLDKYKGTTVLDGIKIVMNMFFWKIRGA
ncbi:glycosyltransferase family 2 protein [Candidatus Woesearchaeota archaeon]|nr:glycosyltransferase family 2 protein [Candidatus Woesearchaeota archaeon]